MILIVASSKDTASLNIKEEILNNYSFKKTAETFQENPVYIDEVNGRNVRLVTLNKESIWAQNITVSFNNLELIIFISRHSSVSATPTLSVHTPGNISEAKLGGLPRKVSVSPANAMKICLGTLMRLKSEMQLDYEVSYECTHHGPSLSVPTMFTELGSSPREWKDTKAAEAVAHAVMEAVVRFGEPQTTAVLGIGGPHYNAKFTRMALQSRIAFGHIIPKYAVSCVDLEILRECVKKTLERVESAVLDWKGIRGKHKSNLVEMLQEIRLPIQKVR